MAGCYLLPAEVAEDRLGIDDFPYRSELNGRGPHAWSRHWLIVPLVEGDRRIGVIWVDDPRDRLLPTRARLQALRLFANQAVAALHTAKQAVRLRHEATHDALTGLPNRRAFRGADGARDRGRAGFALVLCDMDNLKTVNDTRGHDAGDKALQLLAGRAAQPAAPQRRGVPDRRRRVRRGAAAGAARLDAERVMRRLRGAVASSVPAGGNPIEASFGIAVYEPGDDPERVVAARTRRSTRPSAGGRSRRRERRLVAAGRSSAAPSRFAQVVFDPAEGTGPTTYRAARASARSPSTCCWGPPAAACVERLRAGARGGLLWGAAPSWRRRS